jgi:hypothetical protein
MAPVVDHQNAGLPAVRQRITIHVRSLAVRESRATFLAPGAQFRTTIKNKW